MDNHWVYKDGKRLWRAPQSVASDEIPEAPANSDEIPDAPANASSYWIYKDGRA